MPETSAIVHMTAGCDSGPRLLCIGHAGTGPARFHPWRERLPAEIALWAACLSGRERRLREPPHVRMRDAVDELRAALGDLNTEHLALFGHCSGALIATELARAFARESLPIRHLFVASQPAPAAIRARPGREAAELAGGADARTLVRAALGPGADERLVALLAPAVDADLALAADFDVDSAQLLQAPLTVVFGSEDDIPAEELEAWAQETSSQTKVQAVFGDHLLNAAWSALPELLVAHLRA